MSAEQWWNTWNKQWLENAIKRGDDIYLATIPKERELVLDRVGEPLGSYAYELKCLVKKNYKPMNVTDEQWGIYVEWFK